jgi:hypothetical protein
VIPDPSPPFEFGTSESVRERIRNLIRRAAAIGHGRVMRDALVVMDSELRSRPREWGEPSYHLRGLQVTVFRRIYRQLFFVYTVHDRIPMVTLWNVIPTSGHPLAGA